MPTNRPFVQAAFACENVLQDKDGTFSVIRIIDTFNVQKRALDEIPRGQKPAIDLMLFIALKSGDVKGQHTVALRFRSPSDKLGPEQPLKLDFLGGINGSIAQIALKMVVEELGVYWCEVIWVEDSTVLTQIPLRVQVQETVQAEPLVGSAESASSSTRS
jgi:hypothetical protein